MSTLNIDWEKIRPELLGELLREITFVGEGYGCYENFEVRKDAVPWPKERLAEVLQVYLEPKERSERLLKSARGYSFKEGDVSIDVHWFWDGDGILEFWITDPTARKRKLINTDCKQAYPWEDEAV